MQIIAAGLCTLVLGVVLTLAVRAAAQRFGVVAVPGQDRWHQKPTALLGGVAIYVAFLVGYLIFAPGLSITYPILIACTLLFVSGLWLDPINEIGKKTLPPRFYRTKIKALFYPAN